MKNEIKITLIVLLASLVIIGCSPELKIEYVEVPVCPTPEEHGQGECDCPKQTGNMCESEDLYACVTKVNDSIKAVADASNGKNHSNCGVDGATLCRADAVNTYKQSALEAWGARNGGVHDISDTATVWNPYAIRFFEGAGVVGTTLAPCLTEEERNNAKAIALQSIEDRHQ